MNHKMTYKSITASSFLILMTFANLAYAQQYCDTTTRNTTPDNRYQVINNNEVKDKATGLIWQRCLVGETWANGDCTGEATTFTWQEALAAAKTKADSSGKPYRVPNIKELQSLTKYECQNPALNTNFFGTTHTGLADFITSSTPSAQVTGQFIPPEGYIYNISQYDGRIVFNLKQPQIKYYARLVRSEK